MTTQQAFETLPASYISDDFKEWFFALSFDDKKKTEKLFGQKLPRTMNDREILKELNPSEVSLEEIVATLKTLDHSVFPIFYAKDKDNDLRAVGADWYGDGWGMHAFAVARPNGWGDERQLFSRNSRNSKTLNTSDSLILDRLDALEKKMEKVEKMLRLE